MSHIETNEMSNCALKWSYEEVKEWLLSSGFEDFTYVIEPHKVTGIDLLMLSEQDWRDLIHECKASFHKIHGSGDHTTKHQSSSIKSLPNTVRLRRLLYKINALKLSQAEHISSDVGFCLGLHGWPHIPSSKTISARKSSSNSLFSSDVGANSPTSNITLESALLSEEISEFKSFRDYVICPNCHQIRMQKRAEIPPERWKTVLAFLYVLLVSWLTAFVMVIVHDRVPDMEKYPPLPDILLDNIPLIPGAFEMCELTGMVLMSLWTIVIIFHKHRWVLMRRFFSLSGTIFLLRCVTMLITSLSVPGKHLECAPRPYGDIWNKFYNAFIIWTGAGLTLQGVRTCGDYMFSGHTVGLTLLNFFITEYTSHIYMLHTFTWICNIFGVFFIIAAHEHYSIDVFVAFYIASRLFMYYHTLASQKLPTYYNLSTSKESASKKSDISNISPYNYDDENEQKQILQFWFPLFTFFESGIEGGKIPNVFEYPFTLADLKAVINLCASYIRKIFNGNIRDKPYGNDITDLISEPQTECTETLKMDTKINLRKRSKKKQ